MAIKALQDIVLFHQEMKLAAQWNKDKATEAKHQLSENNWQSILWDYLRMKDMLK